MEDLPEITRPGRIPLPIGIADYLRDHVFRGRAVYPAVEAMRALAESTLARFPGAETRYIENADFPRFLEIARDTASINAFNEVEPHGQAISSKLLTIKKSGTTTITRALEHVSLVFPGGVPPLKPRPLDETLGLEGMCIAPDPALIYEELVPFGPAYRNIERLHVSKQGAIALVNGGTDAAPDGPLGSPFPLDASFHAACVWGQRYAGIVAFPVHIDTRVVRKKTAPGETYISRITPVTADGGILVFDILIYDMEGCLREEIQGLRMRDVSGGSIRPPDWIRAPEDDPLAPLRARCRDLCLVELDTLTTACHGILSPEERDRFGSMKEKRRRTFLGARMALKKLARRLPGADPGADPASLTTMHTDGRPRCPLPDGSEPLYCTASHDSRFAVAAVSEHKIGIDVEEISERVMNGRRLYMHEEELALVTNHPLGEVEASARVWSVKEAVSKALGASLADAWQKTHVTEIGEQASLVCVEGGTFDVLHSAFEGHMITLACAI